jgi:hypothetical protein
MLEDALRRAEQAKADHRLTVTTAVDTVTVSLRTVGLEGAQSPGRAGQGHRNTVPVTRP